MPSSRSAPDLCQTVRLAPLGLCFSRPWRNGKPTAALLVRQEARVQVIDMENREGAALALRAAAAADDQRRHEDGDANQP